MIVVSLPTTVAGVPLEPVTTTTSYPGGRWPLTVGDDRMSSWVAPGVVGAAGNGAEPDVVATLREPELVWMPCKIEPICAARSRTSPEPALTVTSVELPGTVTGMVFSVYTPDCGR